MRGQRADGALQPLGGRAWVEHSVLRSDLLGVGDAVARLLVERRRGVERLREQLAARRSRRSARLPYVSSARICSSAARHTGPSSRPAVSRMMLTPVRSSPAMIARSTGAAPRQRGSSDGCTLRIGCAERSCSPISAPNAHTTTCAGPGGAAAACTISATASGSLTRGGCASARPSWRAASATGGLDS